jgi:hypothetical protein
VAVAPEAQRTDINYLGVDGGNGFIGEPKTIHRGRADIVEQHVDDLGEAQQSCAAVGRRLEIDREAAFAAVEIEDQADMPGVRAQPLFLVESPSGASTLITSAP